MTEVSLRGNDVVEGQGEQFSWTLPKDVEQIPEVPEQEARARTDQVRRAHDVIDQAVLWLYAHQVWKTLGYASWGEYCRHEQLHSRFVRYERPEREALHFGLREAGMSSRAIGELTNYDSKTVLSDAGRHEERLEAEGRLPQQRSDRIVASDGRSMPRSRAQQEPTRQEKRAPLPRSFERNVENLRRVAVAMGNMLEDDRWAAHAESLGVQCWQEVAGYAETILEVAAALRDAVESARTEG